MDENLLDYKIEVYQMINTKLGGRYLQFKIPNLQKNPKKIRKHLDYKKFNFDII